MTTLTITYLLPNYPGQHNQCIYQLNLYSTYLLIGNVANGKDNHEFLVPARKHLRIKKSSPNTEEKNSSIQASHWLSIQEIFLHPYISISEDKVRTQSQN